MASCLVLHMKGLLLPILLIALAEIGARAHGDSDAIAPPSRSPPPSPRRSATARC